MAAQIASIARSLRAAAAGQGARAAHGARRGDRADPRTRVTGAPWKLSMSSGSMEAHGPTATRAGPGYAWPGRRAGLSTATVASRQDDRPCDGAGLPPGALRARRRHDGDLRPDEPLPLSPPRSPSTWAADGTAQGDDGRSVACARAAGVRLSGKYGPHRLRPSATRPGAHAAVHAHFFLSRTCSSSDGRA